MTAKVFIIVQTLVYLASQSDVKMALTLFDRIPSK